MAPEEYMARAIVDLSEHLGQAQDRIETLERELEQFRKGGTELTEKVARLEEALASVARIAAKALDEIEQSGYAFIKPEEV